MKTLLRICSFAFLIVTQTTLGNANEHFPFLAQVSKESVNIRAGANTNFEKIDKLNQGFELVVLAKSYDWYKVQLPTTAKSYIRADYVKPRQGTIAEVVGDHVNIRAVANSDSTSLGQLKKGELVKIIAQTNGWYQIEPPPQAAGWVRQDFLILKSISVDSSLMRAPLRLEDIPAVKEKSFATITVKGKLIPLPDAKADMRYELMVDGKVAYYVQSVPNMEHFKGAMVLIKGLVISDSNHQYNYPVLRTISISILL